MLLLSGTDFSPASIDAATIAALWSRRTGAPLHLIHAVPGTTHLHSAREELARESQRLAGLGATLAAADLVSGDPQQVLAEEATARNATLVVLGAVGAGGRRGHWAGSTADRTARDAAVPVMLVRERFALESWLLGVAPLKVLVGFERDTSSLGALAWVGALMAYGAVEPRVLHLVLPGAENREVHATGPGRGFRLTPEARIHVEAELRAAVTPILGEGVGQLSVLEALGRKDMPLVGAAEELGAALLVIGSHQRHGFQRWWNGSVSSGVLHAATTNVVVVPSRG
ncbi:MAG: universal stress protein [Gemmatimonadales bacterium]